MHIPVDEDITPDDDFELVVEPDVAAEPVSAVDPEPEAESEPEVEPDEQQAPVPEWAPDPPFPLELPLQPLLATAERQRKAAVHVSGFFIEPLTPDEHVAHRKSGRPYYEMQLSATVPMWSGVAENRAHESHRRDGSPSTRQYARERYQLGNLRGASGRS